MPELSITPDEQPSLVPASEPTLITEGQPVAAYSLVEITMVARATFGILPVYPESFGARLGRDLRRAGRVCFHRTRLASQPWPGYSSPSQPLSIM